MTREKLFQIGVKALITNKEGEILVLDSGDWHMKNQTRHWDIPGGRIQEGGNLLDTLAREVQEETGITRLSDLKFYTAVISNFSVQIDGREVGLALFIYKVKIPAGSEIVLSEEHAGYEWVDKKEAAKRLAYKYPTEFTQLLA